METYRIRYVGGANRVSAMELVREFVGIGLRAAKELVETRAVFLDNVSAAEARRVSNRFAAIGAEVEVERTWRYVYAYAPEHPDRGDQPIARLRAGEFELAVDHGSLGALALGDPQTFSDESLTQREVLSVLGRWTDSGLQLADSEIALLEAVSVRDPVIEASLRERPDDVAAHVIHGDWLQARGDPRGQLVMLQHACEQVTDANLLAELRTREREFRRRHLGHLFGPLRSISDALVVRWSRGFIDVAFVGPASPGGARARGPEGGPMQVLHDLLRLPIAARMTSLGLTTSLLRQPQLEALLCGSEVVECLRELELGDHVSVRASTHARELPSFARLWSQLRKLRKLTIHADHPPLRALHSDTLEHLELHILELHDEFPEPFIADRLPRLRTLTLEFADAERLSPAAFADLLALPELDGVRELIVRLPNHAIPHALASVFASIPRLAVLDVLDLSRCVADARAMEAIVSARDRGRLPDGLRLPIVSG